MDKIKEALHIKRKDEDVPGDGAVGNIQNPSTSEPEGPTSTELWGSGNADTVHRYDPNKDSVAQAGAAYAKKGQNYSQGASREPNLANIPEQNQGQIPSSSNERGDEAAIIAAEMNQGSALPQAEKTRSGIDDPKLVKSIDPFHHEPEPSQETGPGSHFRPPTAASEDVPALSGHGKAELVSQGSADNYSGGPSKGDAVIGKQ